MFLKTSFKFQFLMFYAGFVIYSNDLFAQTEIFTCSDPEEGTMTEIVIHSVNSDLCMPGWQLYIKDLLRWYHMGNL